MALQKEKTMLMDWKLLYIDLEGSLEKLYSLEIGRIVFPERYMLY